MFVLHVNHSINAISDGGDDILIISDDNLNDSQSAYMLKKNSYHSVRFDMEHKWL
ncbi:unnamed protein product, partial [Rotaria sordida]